MFWWHDMAANPWKWSASTISERLSSWSLVRWLVARDLVLAFGQWSGGVLFRTNRPPSTPLLLVFGLIAL